jgi:hypothetical protein
VGAFFSIYVIIWLFVLSCGTLSEMLIIEMIDHSFVGTLTCVKSLEMFVSAFLPLYLIDSQQWITSFLLVRMIRMSYIIKSLNK